MTTYDNFSHCYQTEIFFRYSRGSEIVNPLVDMLARFRKGKYALMTDITKYCFQIKLPAAQRHLCRLLSFENDDVRKGKSIPFRFCVYPSVAASIAFSIRHKFEPGFPCLSHSLCLLCFDVPLFSVVSPAPRPLLIDFRLRHSFSY